MAGMFGIGGTEPIYALLALAGLATFWYRFCCWSKPTTLDWIWLVTTSVLLLACWPHGGFF
jgi:hypothetical protein